MTMTNPQARLFTLLLALFLVPALLVACDDGDGDGDTEDGAGVGAPTATDAAGGEEDGAASEISIEMLDIEYGQEQISATAGESLTVDFNNTGSLEHDFTTDDGSFSNISADGGENLSGEEYPVRFLLQPDSEGSLTLTPDDAGEYAYFCTIPGHREAGMEGTLTVN